MPLKVRLWRRARVDTFHDMAHDACTLAFGVTYDMVAAQTACGQFLTLTSHRGCEGTPPHKHVNDYICIVLAGRFAELERNTWRDRLGGACFTHHAGETHHDRFGPDGAICLNLHFAPEESGFPLDDHCSGSARVAAQQLAFELAARSREELVMASLSAEIIGHIRPGERFGRDAGRWIDDLVAAISDEPTRRWSLLELAQVARRHPVHVAQSFRAKTGMSLGAFQRLRRLTSLSLALRLSATPLASLAAEFGYCDQSHMNSEFRAAFGVSPGRYRRELH